MFSVLLTSCTDGYRVKEAVGTAKLEETPFLLTAIRQHKKMARGKKREKKEQEEGEAVIYGFKQTFSQINLSREKQGREEQPWLRARMSCCCRLHIALTGSTGIVLLGS